MEVVYILAQMEVQKQVKQQVIQQQPIGHVVHMVLIKVVAEQNSHQVQMVVVVLQETVVHQEH